MSENTINNISLLQEEEKKLYDKLNDITLTEEEKQQIVKKINELSQMRINLYSMLLDVYGNYSKNTAINNTTLTQQMKAIDIVEEQLKESKKRINLLVDAKRTDLRNIEINTYYTERYNSYKKLLYTIYYTLIPIFILSFIYNRGIFSDGVYYTLIVFIFVVGFIRLCYQFYDISFRDDMNWNEYNFYFSKNAAPAPNTAGTSLFSIGDNIKDLTTCIGEQCCSSNMTFDYEEKICKPIN